MRDDFELLREHVELKSDDAFRALVERHAGMVHGAALRILRDSAQADEVAQAVFILLARRAATLPAGTVLAGWLHQTTRFVALGALRAERRRQQHHHDFASMNDTACSESVWDQIRPRLDESLSQLGGGDRDALVLRFLEGRSFAEVATALGTSEGAAKMRVSRALDKLRRVLSRNGAVVTLTALLPALTAHAVTAAPPALMAQITGLALAPAIPIASFQPLINEGIKLMALQKLKATLIAAAVALLFIWGSTAIFRLSHKPAQGVPVLTTFAPMAGEWEGTYESRGDGLPAARRQKVALTIRTTAQGRVCDIDMSLLGRDDQPQAVLHFSHALNAAGDRIVTTDDPSIRNARHDGLVTEAAHDPGNGEWRAGFRATRPGSADTTECRWTRRGDDLIISRQDVTATAQATNRLFSELTLRRRGA